MGKENYECQDWNMELLWFHNKVKKQECCEISIISDFKVHCDSLSLFVVNFWMTSFLLSFSDLFSAKITNIIFARA